jgi:ribosome-binding protein aMBF1 (putative translation factor)
MFQDLSVITITKKTNKVIKNIVEKKNDIPIKNNLVKLENESEKFSHEKIPITLSKEIINSRILLKLKQKDMATKLNIPLNVYNELENGKAIYDIKTKQLINKIENTCKIKF